MEAKKNHSKNQRHRYNRFDDTLSQIPSRKTGGNQSIVKLIKNRTPLLDWRVVLVLWSLCSLVLLFLLSSSTISKLLRPRIIVLYYLTVNNRNHFEQAKNMRRYSIWRRNWERLGHIDYPEELLCKNARSFQLVWQIFSTPYKSYSLDRLKDKVSCAIGIVKDRAGEQFVKGIRATSKKCYKQYMILYLTSKYYFSAFRLVSSRGISLIHLRSAGGDSDAFQWDYGPPKGTYFDERGDCSKKN